MNDVLSSDVNMKILADENIPSVNEAFGKFGSVERLSGRSITASHLADVDVLLVRSVTTVGPHLLRESSVQFVGSATIGTDHVDQRYLSEHGIAFHHAPASNADSVADYVIAAMLDLASRRRAYLSDRTVGVIGCGNVGSRVAKRVSSLGASVLCNDPPRVDAGETAPLDTEFVDIDVLYEAADVLTLHVPLTTEGPYPTHHLFDREALGKLQPGTWLLNTSRGAVVDNDALRAALQEDRIGGAVLDVWENEPEPDEALIQAVDLATPHVAGYAFDGKIRATKMLYDAFCDYLGVPVQWTGESVLQPRSPDELQCHPPDPRLSRTDWLLSLARQAYDVRADDRRMRQLLQRKPRDRGPYFAHLRATYPRRREFQRQTVRRAGVPVALRPIVSQAFRLGWEEGVTHRL